MYRPPSIDRTCRAAYRPAALLSAAVWFAAGGWSSPADALRSDRDQPVDIVADRSEYDAKSGFTRVEGNVVITQGTLVVKSDEALVYLENSRIRKVEFEGRPATWRQMLDDGGEINARARVIDYNVPTDLITLIGDALVVHPQGEISGATIEYDLAKEKLRGLSGGDERVRIRIEASAIEDSNLGGEKRTKPETKPSEPPAEKDDNGKAKTPDGEASDSDSGAEQVPAKDGGTPKTPPAGQNGNGEAPSTSSEAPAAKVAQTPAESQNDETGENGGGR